MLFRCHDRQRTTTISESPKNLFMSRFLPLYSPLKKQKTLQRSNVFVDLMTTVGTAVTAAAMGTTGVSITMVMVVVVTLGFGIIVQAVCKECLHCFVRITVDTAEKLDARLCQSHLCTAADAAANEYFCIQRRKKSRQCAVAAAVGIYHFCIYNLAILYLALNCAV